MIEISIILLSIILLSLAVEAVTEIITSSEIAKPVHAMIYRLAFTNPPVDTMATRIWSWAYKLITCGYCTSVWVSLLVCLLLSHTIMHEYINIVILVFVIHRLSNWIHVIYELVRKGRVNTLDIALSVEEKSDGGIRESITEGGPEAGS